MDSFLSMTAAERAGFYVEAEQRLGLPSASIEKDFWVCWTLRELFRLPEWGAHLTFKGGTSLSKAWNLIERFSEDIDIVIDREFLGFAGDRSPENAPSKKKRKRCLEELKAACQRRIRESLEPALRERISAAIPADVEWSLEADASDPDAQTLLLAYSTVQDGESPYVRPVVKIEMGARSDTEPTESPTLQPYVADAFPDLFSAARFSVRAVAPRRTFWEKSMLLHEESFRPPEKTRKARLARHYYDLWCLIQKGVSEDALADMDLFSRIAAHRAVYFRWSWVDYGTLRPGSLRLVPESSQIEDWRRDYDSMKETMFFGEVPPFDEIIRVVGDFEYRFNEETPL